MTDLAPLPDPNEVLAAALTAVVNPAVYVGTSLPENLSAATVAGALLVGNLGGPATQLEASPAIDVTVLARTYTAAQLLIEIIEPYLMSVRRVVLESGRVVIIDSMQGQGFHEIPWDDSKTRRFLATFTPTWRRGGTMLAP